MTTPKPDPVWEEHPRPAVWDEALLVWNGIVTTAQRSAAAARRAHERAASPSTPAKPSQQGRKEAT